MSRVLARNFLFGGSISALTLLRHPREAATYVTESLFLYNIIAKKRGLIQKNVFQVLPARNIESITLGNLTGATWVFRFPSFAVDLISLCLICRIMKPKTVFEIGTYRGYTSLHIGLNTPDDTRIYTLDLPTDGSAATSLTTTAADVRHATEGRIGRGYAFEETPTASKITCLMGDSASFDFSPYYGAIDFFFIDGAHSYEYVRSDTLNALKCCRPGSVIAWHDFGRAGVNGVSRWLREFARTHEVYSVPGGSLAYMVVK